MKPRLSALVRVSAYAQRGAVSVALAMLILFILAAAVTVGVSMSGSSAIDAASQEEQVAALFLAESGLERAQQVIGAAAAGGSWSNTTCSGLTSLSGGSAPSFGRGTFW